MPDQQSSKWLRSSKQGKPRTLSQSRIAYGEVATMWILDGMLGWKEDIRRKLMKH